VKYGFPIFGTVVLYAIGTQAGHVAWKHGPSVIGALGLVLMALLYTSAISIGKLIDERDSQ
jgi:hypothetical protein